MNRLLALLLGVLALIVVILSFRVNGLRDRVEALEHPAPAAAVAPAAADPYGDSPEAERLRQERVYQSFKQGERDADYIRQRDEAESRHPPTAPR